MSSVMERIFDLIEHTTKKKGKEIAKLEGMTPQNYSRIKKDGFKHVQYLVDLVERYNLDWNDVIRCLQQDYGTKKTLTKK